MKKLSLIPAIAVVLTSLSANSETVRVAVTYEKSASVSQSSVMRKAQGESCVTTVDGLRELCVPNKHRNSVSRDSFGVVSTAKKGKTSKHLASLTLEGDSAEQVLETLKSTGWYNTVELDVVVSSGNPKVRVAGSSTSGLTGATNDPEYVNQFYLHSEIDPNDLNNQTKGAMSHLTRALDRVVNKERKIGIAVLDSAFAEKDGEFSFDGGYSFATAFDNERGPDYLQLGNEDREYCGMHGYGVAGVIGAQTNNGVDIAGGVNDINLYAFRVMSCSFGYLTDVADALNHVAKQEIDGVPAFEGHVDVVNLSLGGQGPTCPSFMQDAIDAANDAGIAVVVAAGNDSIPASDFIPTNCKGIVTVGALDREGELASYSNYGDDVDVSAQGTDVLSFGYTDDQVYWWEGTSFAAPLVASSIAMAKKDAPSLSSSMMRLLTSVSVSDFADTNTHCETMGCGKGLLNADKLVEMAQLAEQGDLSSIKHALADKSTCDLQWYEDHVGNFAQLCSMYRVSFLEGIASSGTEYELYRVAKGRDISVRGELVTNTQESTTVLADIDITAYDYAFKMCSNGVCEDEFIELGTSQLERSTPAICGNQ